MELQYYYFRLIYEYCIVLIVSRFIGSTIAEERLVSGRGRTRHFACVRLPECPLALQRAASGAPGGLWARRLPWWWALERIELVADPHAVPRTKRGSASNVTMDCSGTRSVVCRFCYSIGHLSSQYYFWGTLSDELRNLNCYFNMYSYSLGQSFSICV